MITCDLDLCIYNTDRKCVLKRINISGSGLCNDCIVPDFPKEVVEKCKKDTLDKFDARWFEYSHSLKKSF